MQLKVIGSNSLGNCYILEDDNEALILDAGMPIKDVKVALDFNIKKISGVIVTHIHQDHSKYIKDYEKIGIPVFKPWEMDSIQLKNNSKFKIQAIPMTNLDNEWVHSNADGSRCLIYGFKIVHPNLGALLYITDVYLIKWRFSQINHILVEANFDMDKLDETEENESKKNRDYLSHLSIQETCEFVKTTNDNSEDLQNVILCHLSSNNADSRDFINKIEEVIDTTKTKAYIAKKGLIINL